jgi:glycosyltransferase involved in cell wall biosynthesis
VPFYNVAPYLAECVEGLLDQSIPRDAYEIILVDNNSTDGSTEVAHSFAGVTVLLQATQGSYAARNMGIARARGDVIAFIDPDCRPAHGWLQSILAAMTSPACSIALGRRHYGSSVTLELLSAYEAEKLTFILAHGKKELFFGYTNNMAVRRSVFEALGNFPERMRGGDTIFVRRVVDALGCDVVRYLPEMEVDHLEITTVADYYRKRQVYGHSNERIGQTISFRPLVNGERWLVFRSLVQTSRMPSMKALLLLGLLIPGVILYEWGRARAK